MSTITGLNVSALAPPHVPPALAEPNSANVSLLRDSAHAPADKLREAFTQFVGETFFGQMLKAMRSTVGKPAYFHGGRAEEVFRGQLDQALAEHMTEASADRVAEPMFHRQFPDLDATAFTGAAATSSRYGSGNLTPTFDQLG